MLLVTARAPGARAWSEELVLGFERRQKSRLRTRLESGEEIGLFLPRGEVLRDGDLLQGEDGRVVRVRAASEELAEAQADDALHLARLAYHLGNRHVPVQLGAGWVRLASDPVLEHMLESLGARVRRLRAPFEPEAGAYGGHGHGHGHGADAE